MKEFSSNDFADIFKCSEDGKSVELDINEAKIVKIIDKLRKSNQNIDNIIKSVYNNSSEKTAMAIINNEQIDGVNIMYKLMGKDGIKICRLCVRKTLENTFNEMKDHGYEV
ncbi:hypothetical protein J5751_03600 [bacterium]|nr:hypothetical protein [bacterium]